MNLLSSMKLIGVIHLPPLPGSPLSSQENPEKLLQQIGFRAFQEAKLLEKSGFDALILENYGDVPFFGDKAPPETIAAMTLIAGAIREAVKIPIGLNVLRNDALSALAIASVCGCHFIRVNVLSGVAATDQGMIPGVAAHLMREKKRLSSPVQVLADVHVKHATSLLHQDIRMAADDLLKRALADGIIVTGQGTGLPAPLEEVESVCAYLNTRKTPIFVGSGVTSENVQDFKKFTDHFIIGSYIKRGGKAGEELDVQRIKKFLKAFSTKASAHRRSRKPSSLQLSP